LEANEDLLKAKIIHEVNLIWCPCRDGVSLFHETIRRILGMAFDTMIFKVLRKKINLICCLIRFRCKMCLIEFYSLEILTILFKILFSKQVRLKA
jgi:hypothetical protein